MAEDDKKQNGSYQEVPLAEISKGDVAEQPPSEENKEQGMLDNFAICFFPI